jgi:hypothetical protein
MREKEEGRESDEGERGGKREQDSTFEIGALGPSKWIVTCGPICWASVVR